MGERQCAKSQLRLLAHCHRHLQAPEAQRVHLRLPHRSQELKASTSDEAHRVEVASPDW